MTCLKLREVCECIVAERGIVVLHWEKVTTEKYSGWQIVGKVSEQLCIFHVGYLSYFIIALN